MSTNINPLSKYTVKDIPGYHKSLSYLSWNNNGNYLAAVVNDRTVRISQYDNSNGSILSLNSIPTNVRMTFLCWNPQEAGRLAMCSDEKPIEIWDHRGSRSSMKLQSLGNNLSMNWSPDGNYIVSGNSSNNVWVWDVRTGNPIAKRKFNYEVNELAWTSNSDHILAATVIDHMGSLDVISFDNELKVLSSHIAHASTAVRLQIDRAFQHVAMSSNDQSVTLWDLDTLSCQHTITLDADIRNIAFSGQGEYLAILPDETNNTSQVIIVDTENGEAQSKITLRSKASSLAWHPHQPFFVVNQDDRSNNGSSNSNSSSNMGSPIFLKAYTFPFLK